mmetsp:Transcript_6212/g.9792  ORF Transcript_6212/g.9792 Transcript_6212/m.9792 type:complete len:283 (-) Transcript_6212:1950-2798(-)
MFQRVNMKHVDECLRHLSCALMVSVGAMAGVVVRVLLKRYISSYALAQFIGSFILGWWRFVDFDVAVGHGVRAGFCGTLTTFSSWALDGAKYWFLPQNLLFRSVAWLDFTLTGFAVAVLGYYLGYEHAVDLGEMRTISSRSRSVLIIAISIGILATVFMFEWENEFTPHRTTIFLAIVGALARWLLGMSLNRPELPLGTLIANSIACCIIGVAYAGFPLNAYTPSITDGFCGALSTMSTFIMEAFRYNTRFQRDMAYKYVLSSVFINQVILVVALHFSKESS